MSCQITKSFWHEGWQELFSLGSKLFKNNSNAANFPSELKNSAGRLCGSGMETNTISLTAHHG